jgi:hypothetical protein
MEHKLHYLGILVILLGIVSAVVGVVFLSVSIEKNNYVTSALRQQKITLGLSKEQIASGVVVDNAQTAQVAAETLVLHLKGIAPTYADLMASNPGGKFDPADPRDLTYGQGLNLMNGLSLSVLSFGVIQETMAMGVVLMAIGLAVAAAGIVLLNLHGRTTHLIRERRTSRMSLQPS